MTVEDDLMDMLGAWPGKPLQSVGRAGLIWFQLGALHEQHDQRGRTRLLGEFALHIQCPWRIRVDGRLLVGHQDFSVIGVRDDKGFYQPQPGLSWGDQVLENISSALLLGPLTVTAVVLKQQGDLRINLDQGHTLEVFNTSSTDEEVWRVIKSGRGQKKSRHIVRTGLGYE